MSMAVMVRAEHGEWDWVRTEEACSTWNSAVYSCVSRGERYSAVIDPAGSVFHVELSANLVSLGAFNGWLISL